MSSEDSLWETLEESIRDGYFVPFQFSAEGDEALFPLAARMNTLMLLLGNRMRSALNILRELDEDVSAILRDPANGDIHIRLNYGNYIGGLLIFSGGGLASSITWHGRRLNGGRLSRFDRKTLTTCGLSLEAIFDSHFASLRDEAAAVQQFIDARREAQRDLPF
ncbi:hypothetical protein [Cardiobacterium hominis]|uniref:hypothetical protein n=1 Tax=Cardiobacterium hominis TaxID=2718 RepID=UPI0028D47486|nr:hypothetical protein [Cardiobacterium hominis]